MKLGMFSRWPFPKCDAFDRKFVQRHDLHVSASVPPAGPESIDGNLRKVIGQELMQLDQQNAARLAERCVTRSGRIAKVGTCAKIAMLVGKSAFQHQNFFP